MKIITMKKTFTLILILISLSAISQDIKLGESFSKYAKDFEKSGENFSTSEISYSYNKVYPKKVFNHKVHNLGLTVKANKIIGYVFFLDPNPTEIGIPQKFIDDIQTELGIKLKYIKGKYAASDGNIGLQISRQNNPEFGGDKIIVFTKLLN